METSEMMTFIYFSVALLSFNLVLNYQMKRMKVKVPIKIKKS
jgi:hypothetical protein